MLIRKCKSHSNEAYLCSSSATLVPPFLCMPVKLAQKYCLIYAPLSKFYEVLAQVQLHCRSKDFVGKFRYFLAYLTKQGTTQVHLGSA